MKSLDILQSEIGKWAMLNFGQNLSKDPTSPAYGSPLGSLCPLMGMVGEIGELVQEVLKAHQGRLKMREIERQVAKADALADLLVFMCDYADREEINLLGVFNSVWDRHVSRRQAASWNEDKAREKPTDLMKEVAEVCEEKGHAWVIVRSQEGPLAQHCTRCGTRGKES